MNRKILYVLLVLSFAFGAVGRAEFLDKFQPLRKYSWADKLIRGTLNIVSSPVEVARQIQITSGEQSLLAGWTIGLVSGIGQGIMRFGAGIIDLFTFPFNFPASNKGPLIDPEYVWQKPGPKYA